MIQKLLLVGLGGFVGSALRFFIATIVDERALRPFPFGTLAVNLIGCLAIGILYGFMARKAELSENLRLLMGVGFCGGFTTFSAFALENLGLLQVKNFWSMAIYSGVSLTVGILLVWGGFYAARNL